MKLRAFLAAGASAALVTFIGLTGTAGATTKSGPSQPYVYADCTGLGQRVLEISNLEHERPALILVKSSNGSSRALFSFSDAQGDVATGVVVLGQTTVAIGEPGGLFVFQGLVEPCGAPGGGPQFTLTAELP